MSQRQRVTTATGDRVAVVMGLRTPFAKQATAFHGVSALDMGKMVVNELVARANIAPKEVEQLVYGQVVQTPAVPNIAREIVLGTNLNIAIDAYSVTRACATSLQSAVNVAESIMLGNIEVGIAGGADSFSVLPIGVSKRLALALLDFNKARTFGKKLSILRSLRAKDLLPVAPSVTEYSTGLSMGQTAEQMAKSYHISRADQDAFAHRSHILASKAWDEGKLHDEVMVAHPPPYRSYIERDNNIRWNSNIESYAKLSPAFDRQHGSVTAANSTPLTDGASAVLMMNESRAKALGYQPIGFIKSYGFSAIGVREDMLMGPSYAVPVALQRAGVELEDIDLIEMHEAFAAQALVNMKMFGSKKFAQEKLGRQRAIGEIDIDRFNVLGGSLAYGHPFAATGTRLITQACRELKRRGGGLGLVTACAAGGLGSAMIVEVE